MTLGVVLFVVAVVALGGSGLVLLVTAHRLDRLHVRLDAAWAALDRALVDRAALAVATAETAPRTDVVARLHPAAVRAELAPRVDREIVENELTNLLTSVDRGGLSAVLAAELADAEQRVVIARRVHNDAVRDTLTLRRKPTVRCFRLAGTAPLPEYFEIAEPEPPSAGDLPTP